MDHVEGSGKLGLGSDLHHGNIIASWVNDTLIACHGPWFDISTNLFLKDLMTISDRLWNHYIRYLRLSIVSNQYVDQNNMV